ncbi:MAG: hypothetical protein ACI808_001172 [Paraglaciecola sp.]|jgi:hypothetical protein
MRQIALNLILLTCFLLISPLKAASESKTSPNSFSGMNQFEQTFTFPKYDSLNVIGVHIELNSRSDIARMPAVKRRAKRFEKNVIKQFSAALHEATVSTMSTVFSLPIVAELTATTLVIRPFIVGFEIGLGGRRILSNPDNIVISLEVFDGVKGTVVARVSANSTIRRDHLFTEYGMQTSRGKVEAARLAKTLSKMLKAMFVDIKDSESLD